MKEEMHIERVNKSSVLNQHLKLHNENILYFPLDNLIQILHFQHWFHFFLKTKV